jgi:hypothetical protein
MRRETGPLEFTDLCQLRVPKLQSGCAGKLPIEGTPVSWYPLVDNFGIFQWPSRGEIERLLMPVG